MTLRTVFRRGTAMAVGVLLALLASAGGSAGADNPAVHYVQGVVSAPPGTRLDKLKVQLYPQESSGHLDPVPVDSQGRYRIAHSGLELVRVLVLAGETGLADTWDGNTSRHEDAKILIVNYADLDNADIRMVPGATVSGRLTVPPGIDARNLSVAADYSLTVGSDGDHDSRFTIPLRPALPFALQHMAVFGPCTPIMWAYTRPAGGVAGEGTHDRAHAYSRYRPLR